MDHGAHDHHHDPGAHGGPRETELFRLESQVEHGRDTDRPEPPQVQPVGPAQVQRSFEQEQHGESTEQEHGESECDRRPTELAPDGPGEGGAQQHEHRQDGEPIDRLVDLDLRCTLAAHRPGPRPGDLGDGGRAALPIRFGPCTWWKRQGAEHLGPDEHAEHQRKQRLGNGQTPDSCRQRSHQHAERAGRDEQHVEGHGSALPRAFVIMRGARIRGRNGRTRAPPVSRTRS